MKDQDVFIMNWAGKIVEALGISGAIFTLCFDKIARGYPVEFGWLQIAGTIVFTCIALFGVALDDFLKTVKEILED